MPWRALDESRIAVHTRGGHGDDLVRRMRGGAGTRHLQGTGAPHRMDRRADARAMSKGVRVAHVLGYVTPEAHVLMLDGAGRRREMLGDPPRSSVGDLRTPFMCE